MCHKREYLHFFRLLSKKVGEMFGGNKKTLYLCTRNSEIKARTQFKLVSDMEHKWKEMENIVKKYM